MRLNRDTRVATAFGTFEDRKAGERIETTIGRITFNNVLPQDYPYLNYEMNKKEISRLVEDVCNRYELSEGAAHPRRSEGTRASTTPRAPASPCRCTTPPSRRTRARSWPRPNAKVAAIDEDYEMGLRSQEERHKQVVDIWNEANEEVGDAMAENFDRFNPIYMMAFSGARGNIKQIRQLAGMRGLMSDPKGEIIDRPHQGELPRGACPVLEYFISTHGARKGLADTALAHRRLGVSDPPSGGRGPRRHHPRDRLRNRRRRAPIRCTTRRASWTRTSSAAACWRTRPAPTARPSLAAGEYVSGMDQLRAMEAAGVNEVVIRTVMTCHADHGVCQKCYGWDLATSRPVNIGTAVGIIAAQSIGEPGTQLTMRTFHTGGVAGEDITHGLPRVQELFEARKPKGLAVLAEISGTLQIAGDKQSKTLTIHDQQGNFREYVVSARAQMLPGRGGRLRGQGGPAAHQGFREPARPLAPHRPEHHSALHRQPGAGRVREPGRGHQRQAHRGHRAPDAAQGGRAGRPAIRTTCRAAR